MSGTLFALLLTTTVQGHEVSVHQAITRQAVDYLLLHRPELTTCRANLVTQLGVGVEAEDHYFEGAFPVGRFFFHFKPRLNDVTETPAVRVEGSCDSTVWGETGLSCGATLGGLPTLYRDNEFAYDRVIANLRAYVGTPQHDQGLVGLGHYLHLLQDLTSPAHTRNDAHPPVDPSVFEIVNVGRPVPMPSGALETFSSRFEAFDKLSAATASRFWSEKNTLTGPPAGPVMQTLEDGYALDAERRLIARQVPVLGPLFGYYAIDDVVARAQFDELARIAVRYTASMIAHIVDRERIILCDPPLPPTGDYQIISETTFVAYSGLNANGALRFSSSGAFQVVAEYPPGVQQLWTPYRSAQVSGAVAPWYSSYCNAVSATWGGFFGPGEILVVVAPSGVYLVNHQFGASWNVECSTGHQFVDDTGAEAVRSCRFADFGEYEDCAKLTEVRPGEYVFQGFHPSRWNGSGSTTLHLNLRVRLPASLRPPQPDAALHPNAGGSQNKER